MPNTTFNINPVISLAYNMADCRQTLDKGDLNRDGKLNILDLGHIFKDPCDPERVKLKA